MATIPHGKFTMAELTSILQQLDEQISALQSKRNILTEALKIEREIKNTPLTDSTPNLENSRRSQIFLEPEEIEKTILKMNGEFKADDVQDALNVAYPNKAKCSKTAVATSLYRLIQLNKLKYVRERAGRRPAIYRKA